MGNESGRIRLMDLDAFEVSLVDNPAIEDRFVVIKRNQKGETEMDEKDKMNAAEKGDETQAKKKDEEMKDKAETQQEASPQLMGAVKQLAALCQKIMQLVGMKGNGYGYAAAQKNADASDQVQTLIAQADFLMSELNEGRVPDTEAVEKAGKRVTASRLEQLEDAFQGLGKLIADLKGEAKTDEKEEAQAKKKDEEMAKKEEQEEDVKKSADGNQKLLNALESISKRLDSLEATAGSSRGQDEQTGEKQDVEKNSEVSFDDLFSGMIH